MPRPVRWAIPTLFLLHNAEEAAGMRQFLASSPVKVPITYAEFLCALVVISVAVVAIAIFDWQYALLCVQAAVALNVLWHIGAELILRAYAPGVITAIAVNLPFSVYVFTRAVRERWFSGRMLWATIPIAIVLHGPGLLALFALIHQLV